MNEIVYIFVITVAMESEARLAEEQIRQEEDRIDICFSISPIVNKYLLYVC